MPTRRENETRSKYKAHIAASLRIYLKQEELKKVERKRIHKQNRLRVEAESLLLELEEADRERNCHASDDTRGRRRSKQRRYDKYPQGREIRRREHYREWLATQNVLDSMREADLLIDRRTIIPARDKCPAYGGYPRSEKSDPVDRNTTPGPSRPRNNDHDICRDQHNEHGSNRSQGSQCSHKPRSRARDDRVGGDPSDPSDDSSSDSLYHTGTQQDTTEDTSSS
jgi:hypothetical protein